jgi:hypothetical protein
MQGRDGDRFAVKRFTMADGMAAGNPRSSKKRKLESSKSRRTACHPEDFENVGGIFGAGMT